MSRDKSTEELAREWNRAVESLQRAQSQVNHAEVELTNAANALGKRLAPNDMKNGEAISVWTRIAERHEELLTVTKKGGGSLADYTVSIRQKHKVKGEEGEG